ncbi:hypothetical protein J0H58_21140 [bacterium]|nr:hypothetical protein [bacterium]
MYPDQVLAALAEVYATCATYQDAGAVVTRFIKPGHDSYGTTKPFATAFVRPDRFRFEHRHRHLDNGPWDRYLVWADGADVRTWWGTTPGVEWPESLDLALAGATGVSGGAAQTVPGLLLPDRDAGRRLTELAELRLLGDESLGGVACYRLAGRFPTDPPDPEEEAREREEFIRLTGRPPQRAEHSPLTLWVDRGTFLLRRIDESVRFETFRTETVTTYEPQVGVRIPEEDLRFDPPTVGTST